MVSGLIGRHYCEEGAIGVLHDLLVQRALLSRTRANTLFRASVPCYNT